MANTVKKNKLITAANFKDFDWNKAKLFYHIAKCGSFTKAARFADIDQSVLTRQVQTLETQVGSPLLIRKAGGITLTRKGEELLKLVTPFFLEVKGFCGNSYIEVGGEKKRKIRVVTTYALAAYVVGDLLLDYSSHHPHLVFEISGDDHTIDVILGDADIAIRPYDSEAQGMQQDLLFCLEKKLYASKKYLEKYGEPETIDDLTKHHLITTNLSHPGDYPYANIQWILKLGLPEGKLHEPVFMSNIIECRIDAAQKGIGILAGYDEMTIFRNENFKNILPEFKDKKIECYFTYPDYLKEDLDIIGIKHYLQNALLLRGER